MCMLGGITRALPIARECIDSCRWCWFFGTKPINPGDDVDDADEVQLLSSDWCAFGLAVVGGGTRLGWGGIIDSAIASSLSTLVTS